MLLSLFDVYYIIIIIRIQEIRGVKRGPSKPFAEDWKS